jgi:PAS domain-containing protein
MNRATYFVPVIASLITVVILFLNFPLNTIYLIIATIIALSLILANQFFSGSNKTRSQLLSIPLLFVITFLSRLIVVSTGGFFSPLFITFLYASSLLITLPLTRYLLNKYQVKDKLASLLNLTQSTQRSILGSLTEQVFIVDSDLTVLFSGSPASKLLDLPSEDLLGKNLLEILHLEDENNIRADADHLNIPIALHDRTPQVISGYYLKHAKISGQTKVLIQINPITDAENKLRQLVVIISPDYGDKNHQDLVQAQLRNLIRVEQLKKVLSTNKLNQYLPMVELISQTGQDLIYTIELEDHPLKNYTTSQNVYNLCMSIVTRAKERAYVLYSKIEFINQLELIKNDAELTAEIDPKWTEILILKLLNLSLLCAQDGETSSIVSIKPDNTSIVIDISVKNSYFTKRDIPLLFTKYYSNLHKARLDYGSGLEGFIVKTITTNLGIQFSADYNEGLSLINFRINLNKKSFSG